MFCIHIKVNAITKYTQQIDYFYKHFFFPIKGPEGPIGMPGKNGKRGDTGNDGEIGERGGQV